MRFNLSKSPHTGSWYIPFNEPPTLTLFWYASCLKTYEICISVRFEYAEVIWLPDLLNAPDAEAIRTARQNAHQACHSAETIPSWKAYRSILLLEIGEIKRRSNTLSSTRMRRQSLFRNCSSIVDTNSSRHISTKSPQYFQHSRFSPRSSIRPR